MGLKMRKRIVVAVGLLVAAGLALLIGTFPAPWHTPVAITQTGDDTSPAAGGDSVTLDRQPVAPVKREGAPRPASSIRPAEQAYSGRTLGGMSAGELADFYRFNRLSEQDRWLSMNDQTLRVMEDLLAGESAADIEAGAGHIRDAAATRLGSHAADQFRTLLLEYLDYREQLAALDEKRNRLGLGPDEVDEADSLVSLQDQVFGARDAAALFHQRRAVMALMEKHRQEFAGDAEPPSPSEIRRMKEEYRALQDGGS